MHGGDIYTRRVRADFSINVNPMGLAEPVRQALIRSADLCVHYPDPACRELRGMLAERASVETKQVVAGNGASELITAIVQAVQPRRALLLSPCFSGYERALEAAMAQCFYLSTDADHRFLPGEEWISELRQVRPALVFLPNPGNPAGSMFSRAQVLAAADSLRLRGGILVVDECDMFSQTTLAMLSIATIPPAKQRPSTRPSSSQSVLLSCAQEGTSTAFPSCNGFTAEKTMTRGIPTM